MECKVCKKENLESELNNGICYNCIENANNSVKKNLKIIILSVIISVIFSVFTCYKIISWANGSNINLEDFSVSSFEMETEKTNYEYIDDYYTYSGTGTITCLDTSNDYIVEIEKINTTTNQTKYDIVLIHNGTGYFSTYDISEGSNSEKPKYNVNIIGFKMLNK